MTALTLAAVAVAVALGTLAVTALARFAPRLPHATPSGRSLHAGAIPRAGGCAIWAGFLPVALWLPPAFPGGGLIGWLPAFIAVLAVSALDDLRDVRPPVRLAVHLCAAAWCAWRLWRDTDASVPLNSSALVAILAMTLTIAWSANLYNFMDGSDGLAATMTMIGFGAYGIAGSLSGEAGAAFLALAAATLPFLAVNRPPATMFMGDVGAVPLGFLAATFGLAGAMTGVWPAWFPVLVFLPFIADASVTLARRAARGARLADAHREHYYQRLHRMGAGHAGTLGAYSAAMAATSVAALVCLARAPAWGWAVLALASVVCFTLFGAIDYHWRRRPSPPR